MTDTQPRDDAPAPDGAGPTPRRRVRWRYVVIAVACAAAVVLMFVVLQNNVTFFKPVSEAVRDRPNDADRTMRIGGGVVPGSIRHTVEVIDSEPREVIEFELTEGDTTVRIHHVGSEPGLFKDCAPVVAEGRWDANAADEFDSTRLLIKHDNNYKAPPSGAVECPKDPFKS